jgi:hypothetical protein
MGSRGARLTLAGIAATALIAAVTGCGHSASAPFRIGVLADCTGIGAELHD